MTLPVDGGVTGGVAGAVSCPNPRDSQVYKTIGKAIECAQSGDVIRIAPGSYPEQLVVRAALSGLTIRSEDGSARDGSADVIISPPEPSLTEPVSAIPSGGTVIRASSVTLLGLKIVDATSGHSDPHVLVSLQADNVSLLNSWVVGRGAEAPDNGATDAGVMMIGTDADGIATNLTVHSNLLQANGTGLLCTRCGLMMNDANMFISNKIAIQIENSTAEGIRRIHRDLFVGNGIGVLCTSCGLLMNDGNTFSGNGVAIQIQGSPAAGTPTIHHDDITGNGIGVNNLTSVTIDAQNNYWGCPTGPNSPGCDATSDAVDTAGSLAAGRIDIRPGGFPNPVNPRTQGRLPVAILTTAIFDASTMNVATVRFGATGTEAPALQSAFEDVDFDGDFDLVLLFNSAATKIGCAARSAVLTGRTLAGTLFQGSDSVRPAGCQSGTVP